MRTTHLCLLLPLAAASMAACATPQAGPQAGPQANPQAGPQANPQASPQEGMVVVRDPQTGQLRAPTAAEMQALQRSAPAAKQAPFQPRMVTGADGRRHVQLGERGLVYSVVTRDGKGRLEQQCVHGASAAEQAVQRPQSTVPQEDHRHESR